LYSRRPETGDRELAIFPFHDLQLAPKILHFSPSQLTTNHSPFTTHHCTFPNPGQLTEWEWGRFFETNSPIFERLPVVNSGKVGQHFCRALKKISARSKIIEAHFLS
jgi:hypothetical protein